MRTWYLTSDVLLQHRYPDFRCYLLSYLSLLHLDLYIVFCILCEQSHQVKLQSVHYAFCQLLLGCNIPIITELMPYFCLQWLFYKLDTDPHRIHSASKEIRKRINWRIQAMKWGMYSLLIVMHKMKMPNSQKYSPRKNTFHIGTIFVCVDFCLWLISHILYSINHIFTTFTYNS